MVYELNNTTCRHGVPPGMSCDDCARSRGKALEAQAAFNSTARKPEAGHTEPLDTGAAGLSVRLSKGHVTVRHMDGDVLYGPIPVRVGGWGNIFSNLRKAVLAERVGGTNPDFLPETEEQSHD